jgi:hypothetical protein
MKGIVFTEFLDYVDAALGSNMVDDIIDDCDLPHGGAYTAVGTYDYKEMAGLVAALSKRTATPAPQLLGNFGRHLCHRFAHLHPDFFSAKTCLFDFLESVHDHIHVEVKKLYPDAELPAFQTHLRQADNLELDYRSCRPLAALAEGLIEGASDLYREPVAVSTQKIDDGAGGLVRFSIRQR